MGHGAYSDFGLGIADCGVESKVSGVRRKGKDVGLMDFITVYEIFLAY